MNSFSYLEPVCCSMSSSNCCFLTCRQISQEADQVVWYSHLFQGTLKCLLQHHSSKASILQCSAFFTVQLSHPCMTTGKTIALTRRTFVSKVQTNVSLSRVPLFATPWTVAYQAPLSMEFSRQEYWSGLPFPSPGNLPHPGIEVGSPTLQADALPSNPPGKPLSAK